MEYRAIPEVKTLSYSLTILKRFVVSLVVPICITSFVLIYGVWIWCFIGCCGIFFIFCIKVYYTHRRKLLCTHLHNHLCNHLWRLDLVFYWLLWYFLYFCYHGLLFRLRNHRSHRLYIHYCMPGVSSL